MKNLLNRILTQIEATPVRTSGQQALPARLSDWEHTVVMGRSPHPPGSEARDIEQVGYLLDLTYQGHRLSRQGQIVASERVLSQALAAGKAQGVLFIVLLAGGKLAALITAQGRLSEGDALARDILQRALAQTGPLSTCASIPLTVLGKIAYTRNQLAQARQYIDDAVMMDPHPTGLNLVIDHHGMLAHLFNAQGDQPAARAALQAALALEPYTTHVFLKTHQALLYVRQGQVTLADQLLRQISYYPLPAHQAEDGLLRTAWAELFLAQQQYEKAEAILTQPAQIGIHSFMYNVWPCINLLLALAYWGQHKIFQARQEMMQAIRLAEPEGIIRPFLDCGDQIIPLLNTILHAKKPNRTHRRFVGQGVATTKVKKRTLRTCFKIRRTFVLTSI